MLLPNVGGCRVDSSGYPGFDSENFCRWVPEGAVDSSWTACRLKMGTQHFLRYVQNHSTVTKENSRHNYVFNCLIMWDVSISWGSTSWQYIIHKTQEENENANTFFNQQRLKRGYNS
jgi:hypothetical protein